MAERRHGKYFSRKADELGIPLEAPEGGWGWTVAFAFGICNIFLVSVIQNFALIFTDKFDRIGITASDLTILININAAVCNGVGLLSGPMLRNYSCREVALLGSFLLFAGALLASMADTFTFFVISVGIIFGSGLAFLSPANLYSINSYFIKKRSRGMGLAMAVGGIGSVFMPLLLSSLLANYSAEDTMLLVAAMVLHCVPAAMLLQPVRWHMVPAKEDEAALPLNANGADIKSTTRNRTISSNSMDVGYSLVSCSEPHPDTIEEEEDEKVQVTDKNSSKKNGVEKAKIKKRKPRSCWIKIVDFFDLRIFKIIPYTLASGSMAMFACIETNFMMLVPYIMHEIHGFSIQQIAGYQSIVAAVDIIFRFVAPYIGLGLNLPDNLMYILSIIFLSLFRGLIMVNRSYNVVLVLGVWFGMCRGVRSVFMPLLIPSMVPIERLPAALSLLMFQTSINFIIFGPFIGMMTNSAETLCDIIAGINFTTTCTASLWVTGMIIYRTRAARKAKENSSA